VAQGSSIQAGHLPALGAVDAGDEPVVVEVDQAEGEGAEVVSVSGVVALEERDSGLARGGVDELSELAGGKDFGRTSRLWASAGKLIHEADEVRGSKDRRCGGTIAVCIGIG
jgi:hypothetical protein